MSVAVTTDRPIDLAALATSLGGVALSMVEAAGQRTITCSDGAISLATLQAAVESHIPPPPDPSPAELQAQIDDLADFIATYL